MTECSRPLSEQDTWLGRGVRAEINIRCFIIRFHSDCATANLVTRRPVTKVGKMIRLTRRSQSYLYVAFIPLPFGLVPVEHKAREVMNGKRGLDT